MIGLIKKGIGGFYYVETDKGLIEAKGRGIFKKDGITLMVGDNVEISIIDEPEKKGIIEAILPRKNQFIRRLRMWISLQSCLHRENPSRILL